MSRCFTCLFLVLIIYHYLVYFPRKAKKRKPIEPIYVYLFFLLLCVCVFLKETRVEKPKEMGIPCMFSFLFRLCVWWFSRFLYRLFFFFFFFVSCCCVPNCVFCFFYAATITAAATAAVFLYLFIKRLCVFMSAFIICCVFACVQTTHFILLFLSLSFSFSFFVY